MTVTPRADLCHARSVYDFEAVLWRWRDDSAWHFVTVPADVADDIEDTVPIRGGFGSVKVEVSVGATTWSTSLFPSAELESFVLPMKKAVRQREDLRENAPVAITLRIVT